MIVKAYCPGHITTFFKIDKGSKNLLNVGSLGAGFSLSLGVITTIKNNPLSNLDKPIIFINNKIENNAVVSKNVLKLFLENGAKLSDYTNLIIEHQIQLPQSSGFGTSGAGALSLSFALNKFLKLNLSKKKCGEIAHIAEILSKTGLGTVAGEFCGGIEIRETAGAPGHSIVRKLKTDKKIYCKIIYKGKMRTEIALNSKKIIKAILKASNETTNNLDKITSWEELQERASLFTKKSNLLPKPLKKLSTRWEKLGIQNSMLMFGEGIYTIFSKNEREKIDLTIKKLELLDYNNEYKIFDLSIDINGGLLLDE